MQNFLIRAGFISISAKYYINKNIREISIFWKILEA